MIEDVMQGFTFYLCDNLKGTPASVHRLTKRVYLNRRVWYSIPESYRKIILLHEAGHANLDTRDEVEADNYAFQLFAGSEPLSLKNTVNVLAQFLDPSNPTHQVRLSEAIKRALQFDAENYGNEKALTILNEITEMEQDNFSGKELEQKAIKVYKANKDVLRAAVAGAIVAASVSYAKKQGIHPHLAVKVLHHKVKTGKIPFSAVLKHNELHGFSGTMGEYSDWGFFKSIFQKAKEAVNKIGDATGIQKVFDQANKLPFVKAVSDKVGNIVEATVVKTAEGFAGMIPGGSLAVKGLDAVGSMVFDGKPKDQVVAAAADVAAKAQQEADKQKQVLQNQADQLKKSQAEVDAQKLLLQQQADALGKQAFKLAAAGTAANQAISPVAQNTPVQNQGISPVQNQSVAPVVQNTPVQNHDVVPIIQNTPAQNQGVAAQNRFLLTQPTKVKNTLLMK